MHILLRLPVQFAWWFTKYWCLGWLAYYVVTDGNRRLIIRSRERMLQAILTDLKDHPPQPDNIALSNGNGNGEGHGSASEDDASVNGVSRDEKEALKRRFGSLRCLGRYWNPFVEWREQGAWEAVGRQIFSVLTLKTFRRKAKVPDHRPIADLKTEVPDWAKLFGDNSEIEVSEEMTYTWIGQSTSFIQMDGLCVLTDPQFSDRTLDSFIAPSRIRELPCSLEDLKRVDVVLVSHNHYDHLDVLSMQTIGNKATWFVPKGLKQLMLDNDIREDRVVEHDWWEESIYELKREGKISRKFCVLATPNMHWTARTPRDTNSSLSASWFVKSLDLKSSRTTKGTPKHRSLFHVGDTGYSGTLFPAIGRVIDEEIDLGIIPIGSYEPRIIMHLQHTDPDGAVKIAQNLNIRKTFAAHWGTWIMSDEPYNRPPEDLVKARNKLGMSADAFEVTPAGKTMIIA